MIKFRAPKEMEIILRTTKFEVPPPMKPLKSSKDQTMSTLSKFLPPLKPKPQV
jgi:hypothetical protein